MLKGAMSGIGINAHFLTGHGSSFQHEVDVADRCEMVSLSVDHQDWHGDPIDQAEL
jgi:hypothetical protein